ncbi:hypothetical protein ABC627_09010, partial [Lacticaseibacillus paracasei]|uniref:hypothetical protein n=1 Tax=Lacticaseibacillus paracasei TaxID=1597 RepID=UPI0031DD4857
RGSECLLKSVSNIDFNPGFIGLLVIALLIICWQIYLLLEKSALGWSFNIIIGVYTLVVGAAISFIASFFIGFALFP